MRFRQFVMLSALVTSLVVASLGVASTVGAQNPFNQGDSESFRTNLRGKNEVPGPGDSSAYGQGYATIDPESDTICYRLLVTGIAPATMAHIHEGSETTAGPVVVNLTPPTSGDSRGCVSASGDLIDEILADPENYYFNVHNAEFPAGAVRGQLD